MESVLLNCTAGTPSPWFFVNVASKGFSFPVSGLESTVARWLVTVDSKELGTTNLDGSNKRIRGLHDRKDGGSGGASTKAA